MGTSKLNAGGSPVIFLKHPIQGGVEILLVASCYTNRDISSSLMGYLARMQTFPYLTAISNDTAAKLLRHS